MNVRCTNKCRCERCTSMREFKDWRIACPSCREMKPWLNSVWVRMVIDEYPEDVRVCHVCAGHAVMPIPEAGWLRLLMTLHHDRFPPTNN